MIYIMPVFIAIYPIKFIQIKIYASVDILMLYNPNYLQFNLSWDFNYKQSWILSYLLTPTLSGFQLDFNMIWISLKNLIDNFSNFSQKFVTTIFEEIRFR